MLRLIKSFKNHTIYINGLNRYSNDVVKSGVPYKKTLQSNSSLNSVKQLPKQADVVVIGGGVAGCSALYHLAEQGITNSVLLESNQLTAGTTWHTAGLVWHLRPSDTEVELLNYSWDMMKSLESVCGINTGYIQNGGLFVASNKDRLDEYKRLATLGKVYNIESHVLGPKETKELYPLMNVEDIYGCLYSPTDGTIDPAGFCTALVRGATRLGAQYFENSPVTKVEIENCPNNLHGRQRPQVCGVVLADGAVISTKCVVIAAGCWSRNLAMLSGVKVPLCTLKHAYVVSERIEGIQNMPNVRDHDASVYLRLQGDALSIGGYEPHPVFWEPAKTDPFALFELDWDVFSDNIEGAINRVPVIEKTGIKSTVCGPESFTPDHKPLMGESPEVKGFYLNCGFNSAGMMLSGGCGRQIAHWIKNGRPSLDMFGYDIRRFNEHLTDHRRWIEERSHEAYVKNYSIVYKNDEPLAGRNMITDVLYKDLLQTGCMFQERQGFERPGWYTKGSPEVLDYDYYGSYGRERHDKYEYRDNLMMDYTFDFPSNHEIIGKECMAARKTAALFNMSYFGKAYLTGPDAHLAVDWLFTARRKPIGQVVYTCMCNEFGGTESDLTFAEIDVANQECAGPHNPKFTHPTYYLAIGGAVYQYVMSFINDVFETKQFNCKLVNHSNDMVLLSLQGPLSREILQSISDADFSNEAFPFSSQKLIHIGKGKWSCRALRLSFVGEMGWELHIPNENAHDIYQSIMDIGSDKFGLVNAGYRAIDSLSIEKGYRHWHADLRSDDTPLEAGLGFTCKLKSDIDFQGRLALEKQKSSGLKKRLALFSLNEPVQLHGLEAILRDGEYVGFLRRAEWAHYINKSIGYGYVSMPSTNNNNCSDAEQATVTLDYLRSGKYEIEKMGQVMSANYHEKTLFDPSNKRVKGEY